MGLVGMGLPLSQPLGDINLRSAIQWMWVVSPYVRTPCAPSPRIKDDSIPNGGRWGLPVLHVNVFST